MNWRPLVTDGLISIYGFANRVGILDNVLVREAFVRSYFAYKRVVEDPFAALTRHRPALFAGGHIIDVGANIGYTAAVFARALSAGFRLFAFEPEHRNFDELQRTIGRLRLGDRVEPVRAAVGASEGRVHLWRNERHHGDHRVATDAFRRNRGLEGTESVPLLTIDGFAREKGIGSSVRFIKIDVQGYEPAVCEGMAGTLDASPDAAVAVEYMPDAMRELGFEGRSLLEFFAARGFGAYVLLEGGAVERLEGLPPERFLRGRGYVDLLCTRRPLSP